MVKRIVTRAADLSFPEPTRWWENQPRQVVLWSSTCDRSRVRSHTCTPAEIRWLGSLKGICCSCRGLWLSFQYTWLLPTRYNPSSRGLLLWSRKARHTHAHSAQTYSQGHAHKINLLKSRKFSFKRNHFITLAFFHSVSEHVCKGGEV